MYYSKLFNTRQKKFLVPAGGVTIYLLIIYVNYLSASQLSQPSIELSNDNSHEFTQHVTIEKEKPNPDDCSIYFGRALKDCMAGQTCENFKKNLCRMHGRKGKNFWRSLNLDEYREALNQFNEADWQAYYKSISDDQKKYFPKTLYEQKQFLKRIYLDAYYEGIINILPYAFSGQNELNINDLDELIEKYYGALHQGKVNTTSYETLLKQFYLFRNHLFDNTKKQ